MYTWNTKAILQESHDAVGPLTARARAKIGGRFYHVNGVRVRDLLIAHVWVK